MVYEFYQHADRDIPQNMIFTQHKEEDSRENNGSSDHSSYNASSVQKAKGYSKKESDSQVSFYFFRCLSSKNSP